MKRKKPTKLASLLSRFRGPKGERGPAGPPGVMGPPGADASDKLGARIKALESNAIHLAGLIKDARDAVPPRCSTCSSIGRMMEEVASLRGSVVKIEDKIGALGDVAADIEDIQEKYKTKADTNEWESAMARIRNIERTVRVLAESASIKKGRPPIKIPWAHN